MVAILNQHLPGSQLDADYPVNRGLIACRITLGENSVAAFLWKVQAFNAFTRDNDPYGEHDFGALEHEGCKVFWKIDYYDLSLSAGSDDPSDPSATCRVLTIMLAEEY
jgi:hypothetical protein